MKKTYFNHDSTARNDYRIIKMRAKLGYEGYGIFWAVLEMLFTEENKLCIEDFETLAFGLQCDPGILRQVIEDFDLFIIEKTCFYSRRLNSQIEEINNKSNKAKENAKKRWNATAIQSQSNRNASKVEYNKEDNSTLDKSKELITRLKAFQTKVYKIDDIDITDKKAFIDYWTEPNKSQTKMRFEMEKTWDLKRRLSRWANSSFNKSESKFPDYFDSYTYKKLDDEKRKLYEDHLKSLGWTCKYSPSAGMVWTKIKQK
tara:strand:- start:15108 stop:15881 length:774 start_codon:yes stop_codon:yes gene_type:complete